MLRQRLRVRSSPLALIGRLVLIVFSLLLFWYGLMLLLLALKVSPHIVNSISAYRTAFDYLSSFKTGDITPTTRLIAGLAGAAGFLLFGYLALKESPRPYLARGPLRLERDERGEIDLAPRALERLAEVAATRHPAVAAASGRYGGDALTVGVEVSRAREVPETLRDVQRRVREALEEHDVPPAPVEVTLTGLERQQRRELQ